ncbi:hypothetical protein [Bremerella sp. P1]|uniref:hypothetical protein n=1 Tax=Bremerella sp. P1 TaxID=3026424 RepID=UPI002368D4F5|nr:hypothetical protein [Bremerella sp. P1]WDI41485.1 hypothetical protein PSR63_23750 [Bremerella sp. P1]
MSTVLPFHLEATDSSVRFWSNTRLPFEPKGTMLDARNLLRQALTGLSPHPDRILAAKYQSSTNGFCDVENVLFHNVGAASFRTTARNGLRFERVHAEAPLSATGEQFQHYHEYSLNESPKSPAMTPESSLHFNLPSLASATKPHEIWQFASAATATRSEEISGPFEMSVVLELATPIGNLASVIKPLLDGIISALHFDPNPDLVAVDRLANKTSWSTEEVLQHLKSPAVPALGSRRLLDAYREFIKWNPADDLCEVCTVLRRSSDTPSCHVDLWSLR